MTDSRTYPDSIIPIEYHSWDFDKRLEYLMKTRFKRFADFVNGWLDFYLKLPEKVRSKVHLTEFNKDLRGKSGAFVSDALNFAELPKHMSKLPKDKDLPQDFCDPKAGNTHWRKGLPDEWKTTCSPTQIEWMNSLMNEEVFSYFGWDVH